MFKDLNSKECIGSIKISQKVQNKWRIRFGNRFQSIVNAGNWPKDYWDNSEKLLRSDKFSKIKKKSYCTQDLI